MHQFWVHDNQLTGTPPAMPAGTSLNAGGSQLCPNCLSTPSPTDAQWDAAIGGTWSVDCTAAPAAAVTPVPMLGEWALMLLAGLGLYRLPHRRD